MSVDTAALTQALKSKSARVLTAKDVAAVTAEFAPRLRGYLRELPAPHLTDAPLTAIIYKRVVGDALVDDIVEDFGCAGVAVAHRSLRNGVKMGGKYYRLLIRRGVQQRASDPRGSLPVVRDPS